MISVQPIDHLPLPGVLPNILRCSWNFVLRDVTSLTIGTTTVFRACSAEVQLYLVLGQHPEIPCLHALVSDALLLRGALIWAELLG